MYNNPPLDVQSLTIDYLGVAKTATLTFYDSVSFVCGNNDGKTFCGGGARSLLSITDVDTGLAPTGFITYTTDA